MSSVLLRFRVRSGTGNEQDIIGPALVGIVEPGVGPTPLRFRFRLREGWRR